MTATHGSSGRERHETVTAAKQKRLAMQRTIREAAIREFGRNGVAGTSTQALADAAGITKAQLHYYITSKEDLYREVLDHIISEWTDMFFVSAANNDPGTAIADYVRSKIRHAIEHPDMSRLFSLEMARGGPDMDSHWGELSRVAHEAAAIIGQWCEAGLIRPVDPILFLMNMWAVSQYYAEYEVQARTLMHTGDGEPLDAGRITEEAVQLFLARAGVAETGGQRTA